MISRIYKIVNDVNNKVYIGKTSDTIEARFKGHCYDSTRGQIKNRPLYKAFNKYRIEHFSIHLIEECDSSKENEREAYWISYYDSYRNGYNATLGGDGRTIYNYDEIERLLREGKSTVEIISIIGCYEDIVSKVRKIANITYVNEYRVELENSKQKVEQYDKQGVYIQTFESYADAARWFFNNNKIKKLQSGVRSHIGEVCDGKRKTAYGYIWKKL